MISKISQLKRRADRTRFKLKKSLNLRLSVYRSSKHLYGQLIDDAKGITLLSSSTHDESLKKEKISQKKQAFKVGEIIGEKISKEGIKSEILFDRGNYLFHGRVKEFALGVRSKGIKF